MKFIDGDIYMQLGLANAINHGTSYADGRRLAKIQLFPFVYGTDKSLSFIRWSTETGRAITDTPNIHEHGLVTECFTCPLCMAGNKAVLMKPRAHGASTWYVDYSKIELRLAAACADITKAFSIAGERVRPTFQSVLDESKPCPIPCYCDKHKHAPYKVIGNEVRVQAKRRHR